MADSLAEILRHLVPARRLRTAAHVVKRKMSNYGVKRRAHRGWAQPTLPVPDAIIVLNTPQPP